MTNAVIMRPAATDDHPQVLAVIDDWWGGRDVSSLANRLFFEHFGNTSLIAEDGEGLAGFLLGFLSPARPDEAYVHAVGIRPDRRGAGLGRRLYEQFFDLARSSGRTSVSAVTSPTNHGSIAFHTALGFTSELAQDHAGPGQDRVVFRLRP